jgi:hypothetical protein
MIVDWTGCGNALDPVDSCLPGVISEDIFLQLMIKKTASKYNTVPYRTVPQRSALRTTSAHMECGRATTSIVQCIVTSARVSSCNEEASFAEACCRKSRRLQLHSILTPSAVSWRTYRFYFQTERPTNFELA